MAKVEARPLIDAAGSVLRELVNYGTRAFARCVRAPDEVARGGENEDLAAPVLYLQLLEQIDAMDVLLAESCCNAAVPVIRSAFEASLSLEYVLVDQSSYSQRSLAWTCAYLHDRIQLHDALDRTTKRGAKRHAAMSQYFEVSLPQYDSTEPIAGLRSVLARPEFAALEADYAARTDKRGRGPNWFALLGGPRDRRELAQALNREAEYLILYGPWSALAHAVDASRYIATGERANQVAFIAMRNARTLQELAVL